MYNEEKIRKISNFKAICWSIAIIAILFSFINVVRVNAESEDLPRPEIYSSIELNENKWVKESFYVGLINSPIPNMYDFISLEYSLDNGKTWINNDWFYYSKDSANASMVAKLTIKNPYTNETFEILSEPTRFKYDSTKPTINSVTMNGMNATVNAYDATSGVVAYGVSNSQSALPKTWSSSKTINLNNGGLYYFYAKDAAGNVSNAQSLSVKPQNVHVNKCDVKLGSSNGVEGQYEFSGSIIYVHPQVKYNGYTLKEKVDYTLDYKNPINVGVGTVIIKGKGDFYGTLNKNFVIYRSHPYMKIKSSYKKTVSSPNFSMGPTIAHADHGRTVICKSSNPAVVKPIENQGDYRLFKVGKSGTATITFIIKGNKNNYETSCKTKVTVAPNKIAGLKVSKKGKTSATIKWKKNSSSRGYTIQYATDKKFKKNRKTVKIKSYKQTSKVVKKLKKNRKYYVRICATTTNINSGWSKTITFKTKR